MSIGFRNHLRTVQPMSSIGGRIKELRAALGMNQTELGRAVGVDQSLISDYERGRAEMGASKLMAMADALRTTPQYIMRGDRGLTLEEQQEADLLDKFKRADEEGRKTILNIAAAMALQAEVSQAAGTPSRKRA